MTDQSQNYRTLSMHETADIICENKNMLILFHVHPDGDAVGSAFALRAFVNSIGGVHGVFVQTDCPIALALYLRVCRRACL